MAYIVFECDKEDLCVLWLSHIPETMKAYTATIWDRIIKTAMPSEKKEEGKTYFQFATDSLINNTNLAYVTDVCPTKHEPGKIIMVFKTNYFANVFEYWLEVVKSRRDRPEHVKWLSEAQVYYFLNTQSVFSEFRGKEIQLLIDKKFMIATPLQKLIADTEAKLKKTQRLILRGGMLQELNALDDSLEPQDKLLEKAMNILAKYGDDAENDHAKRSGWRWGGWAFGLFGRRDLAPLVFSSGFKRTTDELTTLYNPKDKNYLVTKR